MIKIKYNYNTRLIIEAYDSSIQLEDESNIKIISEDVWQNAIDNGHNKVNEDGTTELFDFRTDEEIAEQELAIKIEEAKAYLASTDFKVLPDYDKEPSEVIAKRAKAREFIRANQGVSNGL